MGLPVSPIAANLYMEQFENKAFITAENPPKQWKRYVDDTSVIQDIEHKDKFLQYIDSIGKAIMFTVEDTRPDGEVAGLTP